MGTRTYPLVLKVLFLFFVLISIAGNSHSINLVKSEDLPMVLDGMKKISNAEYDAGFSLFQQYIDRNPEHPSGYFFMSAAYELMMQYTNFETGMKPFKKYSRRCLGIVQAKLRENPSDSVSLFYYGALQGYMGLQAARHRSMLQAFRSASNARRNLENALELNPELYDAYLGLGLLFYYASKKHQEVGGVLGWFLRRFVTHNKDLRQEGMDMLKLAMEKGELSREYAKRGLMWMNLLEKNYDEAYSQALEISKESPNDKNSLWVLARIEMKRKQYELSHSHFQEIAQLVGKEKLEAEVFKDVWMGAKLASTGQHIHEKDFNEAESINNTVRKWLEDKPTASIEFIDEKNLFANWKDLSDQYSESIRNGQSELVQATE